MPLKTFKGPWWVTKDGHSVYSKDGYMVATTGPFRNRNVNGMEKPAASAISAVTDLYEALEMIVSDSNSNQINENQRLTAEKALAKARGE